MILSIFSYAYSSFVYLLWKNVLSSPLLIFKKIISVLLLSCRSYLNILDINLLWNVLFANIFLSILWIAFSFCWLDSLMKRSLNFDVFQFIYSVVLACALVSCSRNYCLIQSLELSFIFLLSFFSLIVSHRPFIYWISPMQLCHHFWSFLMCT